MSNETSIPKYIEFRSHRYVLADVEPEPTIYQPSKGKKNFTAEDLMAEFRELDENSAAELAEQNKRINSVKSLDAFLEKANTLLEAHGVEAIRDPNAWENYFGDTIALYVNMGDSYVATLLYDVEDDEVYLTSYGDWIEATEHEKELAKQGEEQEEPL